MKLEDLYKDWQFKPILGGANKTPRDQASGTAAVDFLPNTYQAEVRNREFGDKVVTQATEDDKTNGTFKPDTAFRYYTRLFQSSFRTFKSTIVHKYNAQGTNDSDKYESANKDTPGALYINNP
jgi:hypothetical protein